MTLTLTSADGTVIDAWEVRELTSAEMTALDSDGYIDANVIEPSSPDYSELSRVIAKHKGATQ